MKILVPMPVTAAMIDPATTLIEPGPQEVEWKASASYAVGERRIRAATHRVYQCVQAHSGHTAAPESEPAFWLDYAPTNRYAPFDDEISTAAQVTGQMTIALRPGFFNAVALYGLVGDTLRTTVTADGGQTLVRDETITLRQPPLGWYDWLFGPWKPIDRHRVDALLPFPDALLTLTITAGDADGSCGVGLVAVGDYRDLLDGAQFGGTLGGASAEPVDYSSIKTDEFGRTVIKRRHSATGLRASILLPRALADYALTCVQDVLGVPAVFTAVGVPGFDGLNCFGLGSATLSYDSHDVATLNITVQGMI